MSANRLLRILCSVCVIIGTVETVYEGLLTRGCVNQYHRLYVTREVPRRSYMYFHETLTDDQVIGEDRSIEVKWRIVGGNRVSITEVPYAVLYGIWCGGTLIAPEWVITAAHCKEEYTFIQAGSSHRSNVTRYKICAHFTHPFWPSKKQNDHDYDFQLLLLEKPVPVTPSSRPIAIGSMEDFNPGDMVSVTGWGHTHFKDEMQELIRRVFIPVMDHEVCRTLPPKNYRNITSRMFCAGFMNGTKDSCQGDSGGPAVVRGKLVGLVSFGVGCAGPQHPGVYALIPSARHWIRTVTGLPL